MLTFSVFPSTEFLEKHDGKNCFLSAPWAGQPQDLQRVIVDTIVQEKAVAHPTDSRLLEIARHKVVRSARQAGIVLKQTDAKEGKALRYKAGGYAHAKQHLRCSASSSVSAASPKSLA